MKSQKQINNLLKKATSFISTKKRKENSKQELVDSGSDIIPFLLEKWDSNPSLKICNVIIDVLISMGNISFKAIWELILQERNLSVLSNRLYILSNFPVVEEECIPYLLMIVSPLYYKGPLLTTGWEDLNKSTLPVIEQLPDQLIDSYLKQSHGKKGNLTSNACYCLAKTGKAGKKYMKCFRDLYDIHNWNSDYLALDRVITKVENS